MEKKDTVSIMDLTTDNVHRCPTRELWDFQTNSPECDSGINTTVSSPEDLESPDYHHLGLSNKSNPMFKTQKSKSKKIAKRLTEAARNSVKTTKLYKSKDDDFSRDAMDSDEEELDEAENFEESEERRYKANSQERCRMQRMNKALDKLRCCIPQQFRLGARRLSKIRTLRLAISYIAALSDILENDSASTKQSAYQRALGMAILGGDPTASVPGMSFPDSISSLNSSLSDTPPRLSLREIAGRNLSTGLFSPDAANISFASGTTAASNSSGFLGCSEVSSDESFCTDQRFSIGSPQMLGSLGHNSALSSLEGMVPTISNEDKFQFSDYLHLPVLSDIYASSVASQSSSLNFSIPAPIPNPMSSNVNGFLKPSVMRYQLGQLPQLQEQGQENQQNTHGKITRHYSIL